MADETTTMDEAAISSRLTIVNQAMALIRKELLDQVPSQGETGADDVERRVARLYQGEYDYVLQQKPWPIAARRVPVQASLLGNDAPLDGYNRFAIPGDFLRLVRFQDAKTADILKTYRLIDGAFEVLTDADTVFLTYTARVSEGRLRPAPALRSAIAARLAWRYMYLENADEEAQGRALGTYAREVELAWQSEKQSRSTAEVRSSPTLEAMTDYAYSERGDHAAR